MSKNYYIIPIFVPQEGCPHKCVFCNQDRITGLKDIVTTDIVRKTIDEYLKTITNKEAIIEVSFFGGTFTAVKEEKQRAFLEIAKGYKDKGLIDKIRLSTRPDAIDNYILTYLKEYKVDIIELGVQSLDDEILKRSGRGHYVSDVEKASALIKQYGFVLGHQIMPGLPGDTFEKDILTTKLSIKMKPDICRIYPALVIKDTPMEKMYKMGTYIPYSLDEAVEISKAMYKLYLENNIQVIRIGLQPTDSINEGADIVSGPFHPAFRELVESSLIVNLINSNVKDQDIVELRINPKDISKLYANKKKYFNSIKNKSIIVKQDFEVSRGNLKLITEEKNINITY
ncbi:elongator complex protein 3 [Clostridium botulinum]|uniref:elongator complex protein 3 n=1 Tax=Clostridium botulinum TaxID=1491 RepID=UPI000773E9E2|nr:radical SAM protein [Clostridium botulinum]MBN1041550.1 radical SAM protein [Clostridium botulinum]MBN1058026.1 radical SAM protein [Clostridium botulinum]MBY6808942.1 radical SAM protein [Clostridium botulinum]MBY6822353.1 radical SAM protein [Clostridium botulinum]MBY6832857.1 radical SAM protein [Clostridium botulinum]